VPIDQCGSLDIEQIQKVKQLTFLASIEKKGQMLKDILNISGNKLPGPFRYDKKEFQEEIKQILDMTKAKTWGQFIANTLNFEVGLDENNLFFCPREYERGGMTNISDKEFLIPFNSVALKELGNSIDKVLQYCIAKGGKRLSDMITIENKSNNFESNLEQQSEFELFGVNFGYKIRWFAIKTVDMEKVVKEFSLQKIQKSNWWEGIEKAYEKSVFISPSVEGWTFAVGYGLSEVTSDIEILRNKIIELSKTFGEAQYFESHRGANVYGWVKGIDGKIIRAYIQRDETKLVEGEPTPVEQPYNLINTLTDDTSQPDYWDNVVLPDEEFVLKVAESWSIDPMSLETIENIAEYGLLSYMPDTTDYEELKKKIKFQEVTDWDSWVKNGS
jgi:hypothetical protein